MSGLTVEDLDAAETGTAVVDRMGERWVKRAADAEGAALWAWWAGRTTSVLFTAEELHYWSPLTAEAS